MELFVDIQKALPGFSLAARFETGQGVSGLLGESGAGKSMTLRCIAGLDHPDEGRIVLNGNVLFDSREGIDVPCNKRKIGFLFQRYALFPNMTVEGNIGFALGGLTKSRRASIVTRQIEMAKLQGMEKRYPSQLSGGQQQRVALARALAIQPEALLLDEPFSALDESLRRHMVRQLMDTLAGYHGVTLFVTHNMDEAYSICGKTVILVDGRVEAQGETKKLFEAPPTVATARLTGCRNISRARRTSRDELEAADWGVVLKATRQQSTDVHYVGISPYDVRLARDTDQTNVFGCWLRSIRAMPSSTIVYVSLRIDAPASGDSEVEWEVSKEEWHDLEASPQPWRICLDSEKLITLPSV